MSSGAERASSQASKYEVLIALNIGLKEWIMKLPNAVRNWPVEAMSLLVGGYV